MNGKTVTVFLVAIILCGVGSFSVAQDIMTHRAHMVTPQEDDEFIERLKQIDYTSHKIKGTERQNAVEIGRTWYDYATNQQMGRMIAHALDSQDGQDGIHFTFMKIFPQGATRLVNYDYYDLNLGLPFGNADIDASLGMSGWSRVINGQNDEAIIAFHSNALGGLHIYQDVSEVAYSFSSVLDIISPLGAVFPGIDRNGSSVFFMGQLDNANWINVDTVVASLDYMQTWAPRNFVTLDPQTTDGGAEIWPEINPTDPDEVSFPYGQDVGATAPNGEARLATSPDFGMNWSTMQVHDDDFIFPDSSQYIIENFGPQQMGMYTQDGVYHIVYGAVQGVKNAVTSVQIDMFPILYWNTRDMTLTELTSEEIGRPADSLVQTKLTAARPGNGLGNAYPTLSEGTGGDIIALWQQWERDEVTGDIITQLVSTGGGTGTIEIFMTDIWGAYSPDGGRTWGEPFFVAGFPGESDVYPNITRHFLYNSTSDSVILDVFYMNDPNASVSLANFPTATDPAEAIWYYERVALALNDISPPLGIEDPAKVVNNFELAQNYPNPFNPTTTIKFNVQKHTKVSLSVFNTLGQKVATLLNDAVDPGAHEIEFDAKDLASGIYFYQLSADNFKQTRKMVLMK